MSTENSLFQFEARTSDDEVKRDLELTCTLCGEVLCDIEHGDTLDTLVSVVGDHTCKDKAGPVVGVGQDADAVFYPSLKGDDGEHDYAEYETREILRDHLVSHHHDGDPEFIGAIYDAGSHHLHTLHRMMHFDPEQGELR